MILDEHLDRYQNVHLAKIKNKTIIYRLIFQDKSQPLSTTIIFTLTWVYISKEENKSLETIKTYYIH